MRTGDISISTENIFPIIKKWLYSDCDIFLRELVSNGCDAITKLKKLFAVGEATVEADEAFSVDIVLDKASKTLTVSDNGIGMTEEEVVKYITQIAFSGAEEFIQQYKEKSEGDAGIIGHFGLGFYSAFMVADRVDIHTKSYKADASGVFWSCDGGMNYEISEDAKENRGTDIVLHIGEEHAEFLEAARLREILHKYCAFLPYPIYFSEKEEEKPTESINDTAPLWLKNPSECTDEEYKAFYKKVFLDFNDPLFYIHLNVEYPFRLQGILYFPKRTNAYEPMEGQIKLYNNQVFIADNIKEVIPEFLLLLKGCIDCPDLPLNVSRSFLQNDGYVKKVSAHITKKVADKLTALYNTEREHFNSYWEDINPFIKYGCLRDEKFYDRVKDILIFKTADERFVSLTEYLDDAKAHGHENEVYYATEPEMQGQYIAMFQSRGIQPVLLPAVIDGAFISMVEAKNEGVKFLRIDAAVSDALRDKTEGDNEAFVTRFKEAIGDEKLKIEAATLRAEDMPAVLTVSEQSRRMQEMTRMYGGMSPDLFPTEETLVLNLASPVMQKLAAEEDAERAKSMCLQIYDIARLAQRPLDKEALSAFIARSAHIMEQALDNRA
ncbi:MAG: molecular chaperone HtpG [Ruminococcaceae bacterium]|nr:molecular chaperone HtpG [Oscillospiraceae bacterium]